jgi:hypothetical protein
MILYLSILLIICLVIEFSDKRKAYKDAQPVKFVGHFGMSHASKIEPRPFVGQNPPKRGQLELIVNDGFEESTSLEPWLKSRSKLELDGLRARFHEASAKVRENRTTQLLV